MALNPEQVGELLKMLRQTRNVELTCPECIAELDKYAQQTLDAAPPDDILKLVQEHLNLCSACDGEFQLILETLKAIEES